MYVSYFYLYYAKSFNFKPYKSIMLRLIAYEVESKVPKQYI